MGFILTILWCQNEVTTVTWELGKGSVDGDDSHWATSVFWMNGWRPMILDKVWISSWQYESMHDEVRRSLMRQRATRRVTFCLGAKCITWHAIVALHASFPLPPGGGALLLCLQCESKHLALSNPCWVGPRDSAHWPSVRKVARCLFSDFLWWFDALDLMWHKR